MHVHLSILICPLITLHDIHHDCFGQGLAAAGLPDEEEGDPELHADGHHPDVLLERVVLGDRRRQIELVDEQVLAERHHALARQPPQRYSISESLADRLVELGALLQLHLGWYSVVSCEFTAIALLFKLQIWLPNLPRKAML